MNICEGLENARHGNRRGGVNIGEALSSFFPSFLVGQGRSQGVA